MLGVSCSRISAQPEPLHIAAFHLSFRVNVTTQATSPPQAYVVIILCFIRILGGPMEQGILVA